MYKYQRTVSKEVKFKGIGLHTGEYCSLTLKKAKENTGIVFIRTDTLKNIHIKADINYVVETKRGTTLGVGECKVYTVEHLLAAIYALGIDNLIIEIDNIEPPILDGSSKEYYDNICKSGIEKLSAKKRTLKIKEPIYFSDSEQNIEMSILPNDGLKVSFTAEYDYGEIGKQSFTLSNIKNFKDDIAKARTFCSFNELYDLKKNNLIKGASLDSGIVFLDSKIDKKKINQVKEMFLIKDKQINKQFKTLDSKKLRYQNEPVRHKILDLIGDFSLLGLQIEGHIISKRGGHNSNIKFINLIQKHIKKNHKYYFDKEQIKKIIPHRDPFLLIDEIIDGIPGEKVIAKKTITDNDYFLKGHFPGNPIMPGVLIIECMAQASCFLSLNIVKKRHNKMMLLSNIKSAKFLKKVIKNDIMFIEVELLKFRLNTALLKGTVKVNGSTVATSEFMASVVDKQ